MSAVQRLDATLARLRERAEEANARLRQSETENVRNVVQLPLWPEPVRAVPNGFLRSALFGVVKKGARRYVEREQIAAVDGVQILYTGQRLDQADLDVYVSVLHAVRLQALGSQCRITSYALLKSLGKTDTGKNRATLHARITRLRANAVEVRQGGHTYIGGLIARAAKDEETHEWVIELDAGLRSLFAGDQFTQVQWAVRRELDAQPLAQWLHGFYASHAAPYPMRVETLHRLCGSEANELWKFAQTLRKALEAVAEASAAHGEGFEYVIRDGRVAVEKEARGSQRRHLAKKARAVRKPSRLVPFQQVGNAVPASRPYRSGR